MYMYLKGKTAGGREETHCLCICKKMQGLELVSIKSTLSHGHVVGMIRIVMYKVVVAKQWMHTIYVHVLRLSTDTVEMGSSISR